MGRIEKKSYERYDFYDGSFRRAPAKPPRAAPLILAPLLVRLPAPCSCVVLMSGPIITLHGDHSHDAGTRLAALTDVLLFDVRKDSWVFNALALGRFQANFGHAPDYVVVPGWIITVAFGALRLGGDIMWYGQDSAPTASKLNNLAIAVNAGEVKFWSAEDDTPFPSAFALREALVGFAAEHLDLDDPEGPLFVTSDNDRYDAGLQPYQADNLVTFNELTVDNLVGDDNTLGPWAFLNCLTPWSAEQPDEDDTSSEFMVVTGVMVKYAEKMDSELFELSAVDALANCLRAVARVPAALLPDDMTRTTRLKLMRFTLDMTQPERHRVIIKNNITTVLKSYPNLAKWTGAGPTAYGYILQLAAKVLEGQAFGFDVLPALDQKMIDFAGHYQQSWSPSNNIKYLCEQLSVATPGAHGQTGAAPGGVPGGGLQGQESKMVQLLADIQEVHAEGGSGDDIIRTILASTCPRPIKWVLGVTKSTVGLPSGLLREEDAELPRRWADHLLDLIVGTDVAMKDLKIDAFSPAALEYLRSGKLSKKYINWDRDFICPILRHSAGEHLGETAVPIRDSAYQAMTTSQVLADSDRLATHLMYMPRILQSIGLLPKAENSYMSLLTFIQPKLAKARANGVLADGATNAATLVDAAFDEAELRIQAAFDSNTSRSTSFIGDELRAKEDYDTYLSELDQTILLVRRHRKLNLVRHAPAPQSGQQAPPGKPPPTPPTPPPPGKPVGKPGKKKGKKRKEPDGTAAPRAIVNVGHDGFRFGQEAACVYSREAIRKHLKEKFGDKAETACVVYAVQRNEGELWDCGCGNPTSGTPPHELRVETLRNKNHEREFGLCTRGGETSSRGQTAGKRA